MLIVCFKNGHCVLLQKDISCFCSQFNPATSFIECDWGLAISSLNCVSEQLNFVGRIHRINASNPCTDNCLSWASTPKLPPVEGFCIRNARQILCHINASLHDGGSLVLMGAKRLRDDYFLGRVSRILQASAR